MSLTSALATAMSGLRANQAALAVVSSNIANVNTPGYVNQTINQVEVSSGGFGSSVNTLGVNRQLDQYIQTQLRTENAGASYATQMSNVLAQLQTAYGTPGQSGTLETAFTNFTNALQALSTNSGSPSAQTAVLTAAQSLAQQLNGTTSSVQSLRTNAEQDIGVAVGQANAALSQIADINQRLQAFRPGDPNAAVLMDQRDSAIDQLSQLMDIRVQTDDTNQTSVYLTSGIQLVGNQASQLSFSSQGALNANTLQNSNPALSGVGSLTITLPNGGTFPLDTTNSISSGRIAADLQLRDQTLVQAQSQLDQMAATLASAMSDKTTAGTQVSGPPNGFDLDLTNVKPGNTINLTYTDTATNTQHTVSIVRVDDPAALPLSYTATANPNDTVIGVNFSGGMASIVAQLNTALGGVNLQFSNTAGSTLRVVDDGSSSATVNAASVTTTGSSLANGDPQLAVFTDGNSLYTGAITGAGSQQTGLAGRIMVNTALLTDPTKLTVYNTSPATASGDNTRADYLYQQLTSGSFTYSPQTGLGSAAAPFKGTITSYMQQFLSLQGNAAANADQVAQGQSVVVNTLQQKFNTTAGVNIDNEMSNLIALQNTYSANAHVMSVVQSMMNTLLQIQT